MTIQTFLDNPDIFNNLDNLDNLEILNNLDIWDNSEISNNPDILDHRDRMIFLLLLGRSTKGRSIGNGSFLLWHRVGTQARTYGDEQVVPRPVKKNYLQMAIVYPRICPTKNYLCS